MIGQGRQKMTLMEKTENIRMIETLAKDKDKMAKEL
jgi:hypothetical protein